MRREQAVEAKWLLPAIPWRPLFWCLVVVLLLLALTAVDPMYLESVR